MAKELSWRALLIVAIVGLPEPTLAQSQGAIELLQQLRAEVAQVRNEVQPRRFYVTQDAFRGEHALNACTAGFHMASLWEIFDVTTLKYDTQLGRTLPDSGEGPPAGQRGWIRTGVGARHLFLAPGRRIARLGLPTSTQASWPPERRSR